MTYGGKNNTPDLNTGSICEPVLGVLVAEIKNEKFRLKLRSKVYKVVTLIGLANLLYLK